MKRAEEGIHRLLSSLLSPLFPDLVKTSAKRKRMFGLAASGLCAAALSLILFAKTRPVHKRGDDFQGQSQASHSNIHAPLPSNNNVEHYAILSLEGEIFLVKKGDAIGGRLEVTGISADEAEVLDREKGEIMILAIEKRPFAEPSTLTNKIVYMLEYEKKTKIPASILLVIWPSRKVISIEYHA